MGIKVNQSGLRTKWIRDAVQDSEYSQFFQEYFEKEE